MQIVVRNMTDQKIARICHGKIIRCMVREAFGNGQKVTVDFDGLEEASPGFFEEWTLPLVAEYDADYLAESLKAVNLSPALEAAMREAFSKAEAYVDRLTRKGKIECDPEIYDLNVAWLTKARELARENPLLAKLMMGIEQDEMLAAISRLSMEDIQKLARSGWLCFMPRFTSAFLGEMSAMGFDEVDTLMALSGSIA